LDSTVTENTLYHCLTSFSLIIALVIVRWRDMAASETQEATGHDQLPAGLRELSQAIDGKLHLLASTGDGELSEAALQGAKNIFELGTSSSTCGADWTRTDLQD
jgi:hypothetical protein